MLYTKDEVRILVYEYTCDAWGNFLTAYSNGGANTTVAKNPFTYRGYYYDSDLGLYYLQSRYYDAVTGRFISPDKYDVLTVTPMGLTDKNLYAYCDNNPVIRIDEDGEFWRIVGGALLGLAGQLTSDLITSAIEGELSFSHWTNYVGAAIGGAASALIPEVAVLSDSLGAAVTTVSTSLLFNLESLISGRDDYYSFEETYYNTVNNVITASMGSFLYNNSRLSKFIPSSRIPKMEIGLGNFLSGAGIAILDGIRNSSKFSYPNTHGWDSPDVERWYPFR